MDSFKHYDAPIAEFMKRLGKDIDFKKIKMPKIFKYIQENANLVDEYDI